MAKKNPFKKNPSTKFKNTSKLSPKEAKEQAEQLREALEFHNYRYYVKNDPVISDRAYDKLFARLQELEDSFPELQTPDSPTRRVGAPPVDEFKKVQHTETMLSLDSALEENKIKNFDDYIHKHVNKSDVTYIVEPKFDGLSVELVYENGKFSYGATRGDGTTGEDISENLKTIGSVPLQLQKNDLPDYLAVRGEVIMSRSGFQKMNKERVEKGENAFANPRNAAAGIIRQLDSRKVADKPLDIFFYEILKMEGIEIQSHWDVLKKFPEWGLKTSPLNKKCDSFDEVKKYREKLAEQRDGMDFEIDGIVIKLDNRELRQELGKRQRNPRWAMAWKFEPKKEVTILREIVVQVGRTGMLTPVALLDPVDVGGVTVSRATLHNEEEVHEKDVRRGDKVRIIRAGDVIPEVVERVKSGGKKRGPKFTMPDECPVCGTEVVNEGAYYFCPAGLSCPAQLKNRIQHYASREAMNIENLGDKIVDRMVKRGMLKNLPDLYHLSKKDIKELEGFAEKSASKLYDAIQESKKPELDRFLYALGIRHVGRHIARVLARKFHTLDKIRKAHYDDLVAVSEIGPEIAETVHDFFAEDVNQEMIDNLLDAGVSVKSTKGREKIPLEGKTFVFTGELDHYSRSEAKDLVESLGARATSSVSGNTDYLVVGENPGSKLDDAKKENVKILKEKDFQKMIEEVE
ncbi:MAG: NAD-dependent DNA ligase LigA [Calditrichaeota bacterium]|nr:NAD-dependent DNA ligase LigA [Calditrichota bacterium]